MHRNFEKCTFVIAGQTNGRWQHRTKEREEKKKLNMKISESAFISRNENHACAHKSLWLQSMEESNCKFLGDCCYASSVERLYVHKFTALQLTLA